MFYCLKHWFPKVVFRSKSKHNILHYFILVTTENTYIASLLSAKFVFRNEEKSTYIKQIKNHPTNPLDFLFQFKSKKNLILP